MRALWAHRGFIWEAAVADLRYRYAASSLGALWNVLTPLAMLALYAVIFLGVLAPRLSAGGMSAALFVLYLSSGFLPWTTFADGLARGAQSLISNASYLKRTAIPEQVFIAQSAVSATLGMLIAMVLLIGLALGIGQTPSWTWLLMPLVAVLWGTFGFGLALLLATLNVFFRDIGHMLGVLFQIWMWSLPIVYLEDILPQPYRALVSFNPAYPFLRTLRAAFIDSSLPEPVVMAAMIGWIALFTAVGLTLLARLRSDIRDAL